MFWLVRSWSRLKALGILGMNRRNAAYILDHNPRALYPRVDNKLCMADICADIGVVTPAVYAVVSCHGELRRWQERLGERDDFVVKPNRGSAGRGVLVVVGREAGAFVRHNGDRVSPEQLRQHLSDILSGMYSLGGRPDQAIFQQRVRLHRDFAPVSYQGIPDVRVILYRNEPAMAMLRLPTKASGGRANLHQGGIGAGVDLASGFTHHAVQGNRMVMCHPDTGIPVVGLRVPYWREVLGVSRRVAEAVGLGYVGVDVVVDAREGPMLLEANARPGLAIQIANARGLVPRLEAIDRLLDRRRLTGEGPQEPRVLRLPASLRKSA